MCSGIQPAGLGGIALDNLIIAYFDKIASIALRPRIFAINIGEILPIKIGRSILKNNNKRK